MNRYTSVFDKKAPSPCLCSGECKKIGYCPNQSFSNVTQQSINQSREVELLMENEYLKKRIKELEDNE